MLYRLFEFRIGEKRYGVADPEWDDSGEVAQAKLVKLGSVLAKGIGRFSRFPTAQRDPTNPKYH